MAGTPGDIATLIQHLGSEEASVRIKSLQKLPEIAAALGPERTCSELLPYLLSDVSEDDDDANAALAKQLGLMGKHIGGYENVVLILDVLVLLSSSSEPKVREQVTASYSKLMDEVPADIFRGKVIPNLQSLVANEVQESRATAAAVLPAAMKLSATTPQVDAATKTKLVNAYYGLATNDAVTVRRAANISFPRAMEALAAMSLATPETYKVAQSLALDEAEAVRLVSVNTIISVLKHGDAAAKAEMENVFLTLAADAKSWKVRYAAIEGVEQVGAYATGPEVKEKLVAHFVDVLRQGEVGACIRACARSYVRGWMNECLIRVGCCYRGYCSCIRVYTSLRVSVPVCKCV
eukprot:GHVU01087423.1.p1 GENE.GHVU01087423.1~~GHVU01087423.1.p1  ORF type:complete len:350 (-),score=61.66 GHVU01087423.1:603-1652(-)